MAIEVELKARIDNCGAVETQLKGDATFLREFEKRDTYFARPENPTAALFRLRIDADVAAYVTHKVKNVRDGIEESTETEFSVSDPLAFERFVLALGYQRSIEKHKAGRQYRHNSILVECNTVRELGDFVEMEILLPDDAGRDRVESARRELMEELAWLGVDAARIEERPYTDLLRSRGRR